MNRWKAPFALFFFILGMLTFGFWYSWKEKQEQAQAPVKAELVVYTDLPNALTTILADQYKEEKNIKITVMPLTEEQMTTVLSRPWGEQNGDIVITSQDNLVLGTSKNQFRPIVTESADTVAERFKNTDGYWVGTWYDPVVFTQNDTFYNTLGRYITTWDTLAKPGNWRVVVTDFVASQNAANLLYNMVEAKGETSTIQFFNGLKPHVIQHAKFLSTPVRLAALGETDIGIGNYSDAAQYMRHSYPVKVIFPADGTSFYLTGAAVLDGTRNTIESTEFIKWLLAKETAQFMIRHNFHFAFTNPEMSDPKDSLGRRLVLWDVQGGYTVEGKKVLLNQWVSQVRFRKEP